MATLAIRFELRDAVRRLFQRPATSALSLLVLTCGLGSFLMMLALLDAFVLKPMPFPDVERLVAFSYARDDNPSDVQYVPGNRMQELRSSSTQFEATGAFTSGTINLRDASGPVRYDGAFVTHELFGLLGVAPALGRGFVAADNAPGAADTVVLSHDVWRDRFGAKAEVIGSTVYANARPATVIGVMPPGFGFPERNQVWMSARLEGATSGDRSYEAIGRLKAGATLASARAEFEGRFADAQRENPDQMRGLAPSLQSIAQRYVNAHTRAYLWLMFGAGAFVLMLACANVANLQLVQTLSRQRELAVRSALGAGRWRLTLNALAESLALSVIATGLGLWLAQLGCQWVMAMFAAAEESPNYFFDPHVDGRMVAYAAVAAVLTALVSGLAPAWRARSQGLNAQMRDGERGAPGGGFARFSRGLVVGEIALCVVLLSGAVVLGQTLRELMNFDLGTREDPARILTGRVALFPEAYPEAKDQLALFERVAARLRAEPGVEAVSYAGILPGDLGDGTMVRPEGAPETEAPTYAYSGAVDDQFAATYGVPLVAGRWFDARDQADSAKVVVVDQRFVDRLLGGGDALGKRVRLDPGDAGSPWRTIVGVTGPLHVEDVDDTRRPLVLVPIRQSPERFVSFAVRLGTPPLAFAPQFAAAVRAEDPNTPVYWVRTFERVIEKGRVGQTILAQIFVGFGALGLLLAGAGIYGVLSFTVTQRTREIGLRRAVGASARDVTRTIAGRSAWQVGVGLVVGLVLGVPWALLLGSQNPDGGSVGVGTFFLVVGTILVAATVATFVPTRRALAVDPMIALRHE